MPLSSRAQNRHTVVDDAWCGAEGFHFSGRLTKIRRAPDRDGGKLHTLRRNTRLLLSRGREGTVTCRVGKLTWTTRVDENGYWEIKSNQPLNLASGWHDLETEPVASSQARLFVHDPRNNWGVISDIDDTLMITQVPSTRRLLKNSLTIPPEQRIPVPEMAAHFADIAQQNSAHQCAPIFYVSSAPRQLTDSVRRFLQSHGFPRGVLLLKEVSPKDPKALKVQAGYKQEQISSIFRAFPQVKFALFGDDGESDPEVYEEIRAAFPSRVTDIWIRKVHADPTRRSFGDHRALG